MYTYIICKRTARSLSTAGATSPHQGSSMFVPQGATDTFTRAQFTFAARAHPHFTGSSHHNET